MLEKIIHFDSIDPLDLYGEKNAKLDLIRAYFPKIKIIARGTVMKMQGAEAELALVLKQMNRIVGFIEKYNSLSEKELRSILDSSADTFPGKGDDGVILYGNGGTPIKALSRNQQKVVEAIQKNDMVFAIGPAGTGKTYTAVAMAVRALKNKEVKRIILTRPAVEAGENLGFLPGDLKEKLDPYLQPLYDGLRDMIPHEKLMDYFESEVIQIAPLAFMRGRTLDKAFVILDEAQNATYNQLKMFLTRMGKKAKFTITGDQTQIDLPKNQRSGIGRVLKLVQKIEGIETVYLDGSDVVRHPLVEKIINVFDTDEQQSNNEPRV